MNTANRPSRSKTSHPVSQAMLVYIPCPTIKKVRSAPSFKGWGLSSKSIKLLKKDPNAFLLGAIFDRGIEYDDAWNIPAKLKIRLGHLDVRRISTMKDRDLEKIIRGTGKGNSLHRFPRTMSQCVIAASKRLVSDYNSDASNIWNCRPDVTSVLKALTSFHGIGQKIGNMTVRLLITYYGVQLTGWNKIDVAVDRHVARVFLRTGLVKPVGTGNKQPISAIRDSVIKAARQLSPSYPGALDEPAFDIGREWCTQEKAFCNDPSEPCPLVRVCPKLSQYKVS